MGQPETEPHALLVGVKMAVSLEKCLNSFVKQSIHILDD